MCIRDSYKATSQYEMSHEFTISSQKPTRENYTFLGWSTNRNATTAEYQPNGKIIVCLLYTSVPISRRPCSWEYRTLQDPSTAPYGR